MGKGILDILNDTMNMSGFSKNVGYMELWGGDVQHYTNKDVS